MGAAMAVPGPDNSSNGAAEETTDGGLWVTDGSSVDPNVLNSGGPLHDRTISCSSAWHRPVDAS